MSSGGNQLNKVRTFHSDMESLRPGSGKKSDVAPNPKPPVTNLPPVLTPTKPTPPVPPKKTAAPPTPAINPSPVQQKSPEAPSVKPVPSTLPTTPDKVPSAPIPDFKKPNPLSQKVDHDVESISVKQVANDADNSLNVMDTDSAIADGTIITDQKRKRFDLLPAMWEAITNWVSEGKEAIEERAEERQKAIPKVRTIEGREEVVQKAAKQSALAPKDDYKKWAAKRPENLKPPPEQKKASLTIKKKDPDKKPTWSHYAGEERKSVAPATLDKTQGAKSETPVAPSKPPVIPPLSGERPSPEATANSVSKVEPVEITIASDELKPNSAKPVPTPEPAKPVSPPPPKKPRRSWRVPQYVWYGLIATIAVSTAGGGVALSLWMFIDDSNELSPSLVEAPTTTEREEPTNLTSGELTLVPLPSDRVSLYEAIRQNAAASGLSAVTITAGEGGVARVATAENILEVLDWEASSPLLRAIERIEFGAYDGSPYVILRTTSFDTAFGGILAAESNLSNDLAPMFGEPVTGTFDSRAETEDNIRPPYFVDELVDNIDVRVLRDETETERVVYGFLNKNTIIIVPDAEVFSGMAARIQ